MQKFNYLKILNKVRKEFDFKLDQKKDMEAKRKNL